jgi:hypothetical protein
VTTADLAGSSLEASAVLGRAYREAPAYLPHSLTREPGEEARTVRLSLSHAQVFVLRTGLEPWRKERRR